MYVIIIYPFHVYLFTLLLLLHTNLHLLCVIRIKYYIIYVSTRFYILVGIYVSTYFCSTIGHTAVRMKCEPAFAFRLISKYQNVKVL